MAQAILELNLEIYKQNTFRAIVARQGDSQSRLLKITLVNNGEKVDVPSNSTAVFTVERADHEAAAFAATVNSDGTVTVTLPYWMLSVDGFATCSVSVCGSNDQKLSSTSFGIEVQAQEYGDDDISDDDRVDILESLIEDCTDATTAATSATDAANSAASAANTAASYANTQGARAEEAADYFGSPLVASTAAAMTDHNRVYVYTGSESGYTYGHWYYYSGSDWVSGGVYQSAGIENKYYPNMETGRSDSSDQLLGSPILSADESFLFKQTPDIKSNRQRIKKIKGGTIAWNQIAGLSASDWQLSNVTLLSTGTEITVTCNNSSSTIKIARIKTASVSANHIYVMLGELKSDGTTEVSCGFWASSGGTITTAPIVPWTTSSTYANFALIGKTDAATNFIGLRLRNTAASGGYGVFKNIVITDLTLMFGSTIADRIYAMEQASAGSGVAWFKKLFPATYYPYNPGQLISVNLDSKVNRGFNQFDKSTILDNKYINGIGAVADSSEFFCSDYIPCFPNTVYYSNTDVNGRIYTHSFFDANKTFIGNNAASETTFTTPDNAYYMRVNAIKVNISASDICINLSDSTLNGTYVSYEGHSYAFDPALELRGILSLDENDELVFDNGDEYLPGGEHKIRYGIVDLGTLNWVYSTNYFYTPSIMTIAKKGGGCVSTRYIYYDGAVTSGDKLMKFNSSNAAFEVSDSSYTDAAAFKTAMSGVYLVYELATPTTEQSQPYASTEVVFPNGTEEMVALGTPLLPVPIEYEYLEDLTGKLKHLTNKDNSLPEYNVGFADQLNSSIKVSDSTPFNFRTAGGSVDIGNRAFHKAIVGGTIAWNQIVPFTAASASTNGVTVTNNGDGSWSVSTDAGGATADFSKTIVAKSYIADHKFLLTGCPAGGDDSEYYLSDAWASKRDFGNGVIYNSVSSYDIRITVKTGTILTTPVIFKPQLFDLTLMFGSTIADYIYSLETATPGAGVAWFKKLFPKSYYAYNAGTLYSVKTSKAVNTGFNQWDEEWEKGYYNVNTGESVSSNDYIRSKNSIMVIPGTTYYFALVGTYANNVQGVVLFYDKNGSFISSVYPIRNETFTTPSNCHIVKFYMYAGYGSTYNHDICINLSWDGSRDGEYEPYEANEYAIDDVELRGIPKLDANNKLYWDGDTYKSSGDHKIRRGRVDLGSLTWNKGSGTTVQEWYIPISSFPDIKVVSGVSNGLICTRFVEATGNGEGTMIFGGATMRFYTDGYSTTDQIKTAMSGVYLEYFLTTETDSTADPFTSPMIVNDFGTESFNDADYDASNRDVEIPVGHDTEYPINMRKKLEDLPDGNTIMDLFGNVLRNVLAVGKSISFNKTAWVDLGTLEWSYVSQRFRASINNAVVPGITITPNAVTTAYQFYPANSDFGSLEKAITFVSAGVGNVLIRDSSYTDATTFTAAMKGVLLAYETT